MTSEPVVCQRALCIDGTNKEGQFGGTENSERGWVSSKKTSST